VSKTSNHDRFAAVFQRRVGRAFSMKEIFRIMSAESDIEPGSIQPALHADPDKAPRCPCSGTPRQIFDHLDRARYKVRRFRK
jgi:hypothetical protein